MASMFSGALQLTDLNDFITPSQECVKPVTLKKKDGKTGSVVISDDGEYFETNQAGVTEKLEKATITLNDCLACSGCITSAESILITQQSQEELYRIIEENKKRLKDNEFDKMKTIVISISPQSRASLAAKYNLDLKETAEKLTHFFHKIGIKFIFDTTLSREFSLAESLKEFICRFKENNIGVKGTLPMLSSACPGWVCYAEKTHGDYILPYISTVKSPQQIMGSLVKDFLATKLQIRPDQIYHVTVMPCFDKKLEASRTDFYNELYNTRDVDCVITSIEVETMLKAENINLNELPSDTLDHLSLDSNSSELYNHSGSTSGGYSDYIFCSAAKELFGDSELDLEYKTLRNQDLKEVVLEKDGNVVLRFAIANGFRNIQNIVQKLKRGKSPYHFVEVMACPAGCANGGAQIRPSEEETAKELLLKVQNLYHSLPNQTPAEHPFVKQLYQEWLGGEASPKAKQMLRTQYHAVEKMNNALLIKW